MIPRSQAARDAMNREQRALLDRGPMTPEEQVRFDEERAWTMYEAEQRRERIAAARMPEAA